MGEDLHAYLIMAHHRPDLLRQLLAALDDPRNDIYLHVDRKASPEMKAEELSVAKAKLLSIPSMEVNWGGYSQIECTLRLLKAALADRSHARYHLMTGSTYPLRNQDEIHDFFREHPEKEHIALDAPAYERVRYRWLFNEHRADTMDKPRRIIRGLDLIAQRWAGRDRFERFEMEHKKGLAYWSVTEVLASHVVEHEDVIREMLKWSVCGDEVFMQTIAWNSPFREGMLDDRGVANDSLRITTWPLEDGGIERPGHNFLREDLDMLLESHAFFALKFEGPDGPGLIEEIKGRRHV